MNIISCASDNDTTVKLVGAMLSKDKDGYYLSLSYDIEDDKEIKRLHIPHAQLPISEDSIRMECFSPLYPGTTSEYFLNLYATKARLMPDSGTDIAYTVKTIKTKTKEMTLEEIEKKLGHKIKLVTKKGTTK